MAYNFPHSPVVNDVFAPAGGPIWKWNGTAWVQLPNSALTEAPVDGLEYVRKNAAWVTSAAGAPSWASITGKPATFPPDAHVHAQADVTGLLAGQSAQDTAISGKEPTIAAGTAAQYWQGTKTWQTLNSAAVGLGNVDNTADSAKPVSTAQAAADALKADIAGATFTGKVSTPAATAAIAGFNIGSGVNVTTTFTDGDLWITSSGNFLARLNGTSYFVATRGQTQTFTAAQTFAADVTIAKATPSLFIDKAASGQESAVQFRTTSAASGLRWKLLSDTSAESAGNGSHFRISRHDDAGTLIENALVINRSTGVVTSTRSLGISAPAPVAGGTAGNGLLFSNITNFGIFYGSGAPTLTAAQGSLYLRTDGSSNVTRLYVNTTGSTVWTAVNTVA